MQKNRKSRKFDWIKQDNGTFIQQTRSVKYDENKFIAIDDIYFKFNKYLTGVTYTYINNLNDIYNKENLLTGDGYSIVNMYNEYDVIDRVLKNIIFVDVAADTHIDISKQWTQINGVNLKSGHLVLLKNQNSGSESENDIYIVTNKNFLINANFLSNREKSDKFSCSVKLGNNSDKQFFLLNSGDNFPITGEAKFFIEGKSFILKNLVKYDLESSYSDYSSAAKIFFTDYDIARKQLNTNAEMYNDIEFYINKLYLSSELARIDYHHNSYIIRSGFTYNSEFTGVTNQITNTIFKGYTSIPYSSFFDVFIGDYIELNIYNDSIINSGSTNILTLDTFVKDIKNGYIILEDVIPNRIINELKNNIFSIENLNIGISWDDTLNKLSYYTPYSDYFNVVASSYDLNYLDIKISTKYCDYDKYFDYDGLTIHLNDNNNWQSYTFNTYNQYLNYKLYDNLNRLEPSGFTMNYSLYNDFILTGFTFVYTDNNRIRIVYNQGGLLNNFKEYTYVDIFGENINLSDNYVLTEDDNVLTMEDNSYESIEGVIYSGKSLIYSVNDTEMIIEKPSSFPFFPASNIVSIQNIDGLYNISDILYQVYMNESFDWYIQKNDNERKSICKSYADILILNVFFRNYATGILYENDNNEFLLKLFNLGKNIDSNSDSLLYFSTIELVYIGADRKTRLPVPLTILSGNTIDVNWNILNCGSDDSLSGINGDVLGDVIDAGINSNSPGKNTTPLIYTLIDGGLNSSISNL